MDGPSVPPSRGEGRLTDNDGGINHLVGTITDEARTFRATSMPNNAALPQSAAVSASPIIQRDPDISPTLQPHATSCLKRKTCTNLASGPNLPFDDLRCSLAPEYHRHRIHEQRSANYVIPGALMELAQR